MFAATEYADHFRQALEECDVAVARRLWMHIAPGLPQPASDYEALQMIHYSRTLKPVVRMRQRAWSHRWLLDHGLPSGLPDRLRPRAERIYPKVVGAVGISVNFSSPDLRPLGAAVQQAMSDAVEDAYAHRQTEPTFIKARMAEARAKVMKN